MDENTRWQKLAAEFLGTAFLVFVGVGSVPALLIVNDANGSTFSGSDLGIISLAFATIVIVTVYVFGYIGGNHINPAVTFGLAATGKFPWSEVPAYVVAQVAGAVAGRLHHRRRARHQGQRLRARRRGVRRRDPVVPGVLRRVHRHVPAGVRGLRRDLPQGGARLGRPGHRHGGLRRDHPGRADHRRLDQPGPHHRPDARPADHGRRRSAWEQWPVYVGAELLAGVAAALAVRFHCPHGAGQRPATTGVRSGRAPSLRRSEP